MNATIEILCNYLCIFRLKSLYNLSRTVIVVIENETFSFLRLQSTRCLFLDDIHDQYFFPYSWVTKLNDINGIEKNYEIALCILKEGKHKSGMSSVDKVQFGHFSQCTCAVNQCAKGLVKSLETMCNVPINVRPEWRRLSIHVHVHVCGGFGPLYETPD